MPGSAALTRPLPLVALLAAAGAAGACVDPVVDLGADEGQWAIAADVPAELGRSLDLLFVVDNTDGMAARQTALSTSFQRLLAFLEFAEGGVPDLHIGVVFTDMGVGPYAVPGCSAGGDGGALQAAPRLPSCEPMADPFMVDLADPTAGRWRNFGGEPADAFACIARLGTSGCGFEQPLAALRRVVDGDNPDDAGFLRPDAVLGVVLLTDDDDCSARDMRLFDPGDESLGPASFRCFDHGVQCEGDDVFERGHPGPRQGCRPREDSPLVDGVEPYIDLLYGRKDADQIVVAGLFGDPTIVEVSVDVDGEPQLVPSCSGDGDEAYPAVRLQAFLDGFPRHSDFESICSASVDPNGALATTARELRKALGTRCLDGHLADDDSTRAGLQPECRTTLELPGGESREVVACDEPYYPGASSVLPCFTLSGGAAPCGDFPTQLAVTVHDEPGTPPSRARTIVECRMR